MARGKALFLRKKRSERTPGKKEEALAMLQKPRRPGERCAGCGHWSVATEYGVDERSGYCDRWEKLTDRDFWCEEFLSQDQFKKMQDQLAEDSEDFLDEET